MYYLISQWKIKCNCFVTFFQTLNPKWNEEFVFRVSLEIITLAYKGGEGCINLQFNAINPFTAMMLLENNQEYAKFETFKPFCFIFLHWHMERSS